jgi:hypothetical protein
LTARVTVFSDNSRQRDRVRQPNGRTADVPRIAPFAFETLSVVYPVIMSTANSDLYDAEYTGTLKLDDRVVDSKPELLRGYPAGLILARFDASEAPRPQQAREVGLELSISTRCYRLTLDEAAAGRIPWPTAAYPAVAQSTFASQLWLDQGINGDGQVEAYDAAPIDAAITKYLREAKVASPKDVTPLRLAKILTQKVWRDIQISGQGHAGRSGTGQLAGLIVQAPSITLKEGRGSEHDVPALLCTLMRRAGLPARLVVGYNASEKDDADKGTSKSDRRLRTWVEFCIFDDKANTLTWIPVDVVELRKSSSRPQELDRPWRGFGGGDIFDSLIPIAFHFHPPTDVVAYGNPGLWGWFVTPAAPDSAEQTLDFRATRKAVRGGTPSPGQRNR